MTSHKIHYPNHLISVSPQDSIRFSSPYLLSCVDCSKPVEEGFFTLLFTHSAPPKPRLACSDCCKGGSSRSKTLDEVWKEFFEQSSKPALPPKKPLEKHRFLKSSTGKFEGRTKVDASKGFLIVTSVLSDGIASAHGIRKGDVILQFGSMKVKTFNGLNAVRRIVVESAERKGAIHIVIGRRQTDSMGGKSFFQNVVHIQLKPFNSEISGVLGMVIAQYPLVTLIETGTFD